MKVVELKREMDERFHEVDKRFHEVGKRFDEVDKRFAEVNVRIDTTAADTRRHFDVVAESLKTSIATVAEGVAALSTQIAEMRSERVQIVSTPHDHEDRLHALEQPPG